MDELKRKTGALAAAILVVLGLIAVLAGMETQ